MSSFYKIIGGGFDKLEIKGNSGSEWLEVRQQIGTSGDEKALTIRSLEEARDLHYALGRYLEWKGK